MYSQSKKQVEGVRSVRINYSRQQIYPSGGEELRPGQQMRIVMKGSDTGNVDIANTRINFKLEIERAAGAANVNPMVLNKSPADLVEVQHIQWNGIEMKGARQTSGDQIYRKIRYLLQDGQNANRLMQHLEPNITDKQTPFDDTTEETKAQSGLYIDGQWRTKGKPDVFIPRLERSRLEDEVARHYVRNGAVGGGAVLQTYANNTNTQQKYYSVALGDLCPELRDFKYVDAQMLMGSGLAIQMRLVDPQVAFCILPRYGQATAIANTAGDQSGLLYNPLDSYIISDYFLSIPTHDKVDETIPLGIAEMPQAYMSFNHNKVSVGLANSQVTHQWSVGNKAYCMGVCVVYTNAGLTSNVVDGTEANLKLGENYDQGFPSDTLGAHSLDYFWPPRVTQSNLQVGQTNYAMQSGPPIADRGKSSYLLAVDQAVQMFGTQFSTSIERFLTIDHVQFIPVQKKLSQGELFQFYQTFDNGAQVGANLQCHFLTVLVHSMSFDGGQVKVE